MNGKGGGNTVKELTLNQNQYDALFSYFYSNGPFVFDDSNYEAGINAGGKYASRAKARRELRDYIINNNGNYSDERIIQLFVNSKGGSIDFEYKDRRTKEANVFNKK